MNNMTQHAVSRMQQRGIKTQTVEMLLQCGRKTHDHNGATILHFDKQARARLRERYGQETYRSFDGQLNAYAVVAANGSIMTVGHRVRRIGRN
jgi:hypothetical protein